MYSELFFLQVDTLMGTEPTFMDARKIMKITSLSRRNNNQNNIKTMIIYLNASGVFHIKRPLSRRVYYVMSDISIHSLYKTRAYMSCRCNENSP